MRCRSSASYRILHTLAASGLQGMLQIDILAQEVNLSRRQVLDHLAALEAAGLLTRKRGNHCTWYRVRTRPEEPSEGLRPNDHRI